jgi:hypothetical protein
MGDLSILRANLAKNAEATKLKAYKIAAKDISRSTIAAIASATKEARNMAPEDLLPRLRQDPALTQAIVSDVRMARNQARLLILGSLASGYQEQVNGTRIKGVQLKAEFDEVTRMDMANYPINGESASENADFISEKLRHEIYKTITSPVINNTSDLIASLGSVSEDHATRVSDLVEEAYFHGAKLGFTDTAKALVGSL